MLPVNFAQLYYFWTAVRAGSVSRAAERLLLNQSTVSVQLRQLERSLGRSLLVRGRRGIRPTEAGRVAAEHCEAAFGHLEDMLGRLADPRTPVRGVFRLGVSQAVGHAVVLAALERIRVATAGVAARVVSRSSEELEGRLEAGLLDLVVSDLDLSVRLGRDYRARLAARTPLWFVCAPALAEGAGPFPACMGTVPLLLRGVDNPVHQEARDFLRRRGIAPRVAAEAEDPNLLRAMLLKGEGAALFDRAAVDAELSAGRLVALHRRPVPVFERVWYIARRRHALRGDAVRSVEALMRPGPIKEGG